MNLETIWKLLILLAVIAAVIAVVQLDWSIGPEPVNDNGTLYGIN